MAAPESQKCVCGHDDYAHYPEDSHGEFYFYDTEAWMCQECLEDGHPNYYAGHEVFTIDDMSGEVYERCFCGHYERFHGGGNCTTCLNVLSKTRDFDVGEYRHHVQLYTWNPDRSQSAQESLGAQYKRLVDRQTRDANHEFYSAGRLFMEKKRFLPGYPSGMLKEEISDKCLNCKRVNWGPVWCWFCLNERPKAFREAYAMSDSMPLYRGQTGWNYQDPKHCGESFVRFRHCLPCGELIGSDRIHECTVLDNYEQAREALIKWDKVVQARYEDGEEIERDYDIASMLNGLDVRASSVLRVNSNDLMKDFLEIGIRTDLAGKIPAFIVTNGLSFTCSANPISIKESLGIPADKQGEQIRQKDDNGGSIECKTCLDNSLEPEKSIYDFKWSWATFIEIGTYQYPTTADRSQEPYEPSEDQMNPS